MRDEQPAVNATPAQSQHLMDIWTQVLAAVAKKVSRQSFETWFRPIVLVGCDQSGFQLSVPNENFGTWLLENYSEILNAAMCDVVGAPRQVQVCSATPPCVPNESISLPVVQASALQKADTPQPWLIEGLWTAQAVGILGGQPKSYKTWLALEMAVSVASGSPCLGTFRVEDSGPVLLYAAEDPSSTLRIRLESIARSRAIDFDHLDIRVITAASLRLDSAEDQDRLRATIAHHRPAFLVLDPLVRIHALDENVAGQMAALLGYFRALQRESRLAIALIHHARKNISAAGPGYNLRGSSDVYAWLDSLLYLQRHKDQLILSIEHRSAPGLGPFTLKLVESSGNPHLELVSLEGSSISQENLLSSRILELLSNTPAPLTADSLRSTLRVRKERLVDALRQLTAEGKVNRLERGYSLSPNQPIES